MQTRGLAAGMCTAALVTSLSILTAGAPAFASEASDAARIALERRSVDQARLNRSLGAGRAALFGGRILAAALPVDADDDGMPDDWETAHDLSPTDPTDAWLDPDGDRVVNLFEFQLGSDPASRTTPPRATVARYGGTYRSVADAIGGVAPGTVIRVAAGTYATNYRTFNAKKVMVQGGWNATFTMQDPGALATVLDGGMTGEVLYFAPGSGESAIILEGLRFVGGGGTFGAVNLLASGIAVMRTSVLNCTLVGNQSGVAAGILSMDTWGMSVSDRTIANTVIAGNDGTAVDGAVTDDGEARWRLVNATLASNRSSTEPDPYLASGHGLEAFTLDRGSLGIHVSNSVVWGNAQTDVDVSGSVTVNADHSDVGGVATLRGAVYAAGDGMFAADPLFASPAAGDFHLTAASPCIDAGIGQGVPGTDFEGEVRLEGPGVDVGADEGVFAPGLNDDVASPQTVAPLPYGHYQDAAAATEAVDDPVLPCIGGQGRRTVWFRVTPPVSSVMTVDTVGSDFDTVVGVWSGSAGSLASIGCNNDIDGAAGNLRSRVKVLVTGGQTYLIEVAGATGGGRLALHVGTSPVTPTALSPVGFVADRTPTYTWTKVDTATKYRYQLVKEGKRVSTKIVTPAACGAGTCSDTPTLPLDLAACKWRVQSMVEGEWRKISAFRSFAVFSPLAGFWAGSGTEFYVTDDRGAVDHFAMYLSIPACGLKGKLTFLRPVPIVNGRFAFSYSGFSANGTFDGPQKAHGSMGLDRLSIPGCGYVSTPKVPWSAAWSRPGQPLVAAADPSVPLAFGAGDEGGDSAAASLDWFADPEGDAR